MPSSAPEDWRESLYEDLASDERAQRASPGKGPSISRYEILNLLGEGAAGQVFRARHRELGREVALKVLRPVVGLSELARQRFRREAQTAAGLSHPRIVSVHDAGEENGVLYLVMELVEGKPLSEVLAGKTRPSREVLARTLEQAARGVGAAHERGVVHRDLKPANILLTPSGEPKVADFGLAHLLDSSAELTRTGSTVGTPLYMAPEQVEGRVGDITPRTDVYSLGAILYEILTGRPPHLAATLMELYGKIVREEPAAPRALGADIPRDLETIALKALEKEPGRRYPTAAAFAEDLRRALDGERIEGRPAGLAYRAWRRWRRNRLAYSLGAGAALALLTAAAVGWTEREKSRRLVAEREKRVDLLRDHARISLDAVLKLRRVGANQEMDSFIPGLETAYRQALEGAPDLAEIEYLMGRMHRALMDDEKAEAFQERALAKDPLYAPALYERALLLTGHFGVGLGKAIAESRQLPAGPATAKVARALPPVDPEDVEDSRESLVRLRERILRDCAALERKVAAGAADVHITDAHVRTVQGLLAFHRKDHAKAREILEGVIQDNPRLEDAWYALGMTLGRQAALEEAKAESREATLKRFEEAEALWTRAISHDVGYGLHWLGRASVSRARGLFYMRRGGDAVPEFRKAEADLGRVLEITSKVPEALYRRANVRDLAGVCLQGAGQNPTADYDGAERDLSEGIARFGEHGDIWIARSSVRVHRALWKSRRGEDPFGELAAAEEDLRNVLRLDPTGDAAYMSLGYLKTVRAGFRKRQGTDPMPDLVAAERDLTEAVRLRRDYPVTWSHRGNALLDKALLRTERGEDAFDDLLQAEDDFTESVRLAPTNADSWARRGTVRTQLGRHYEKRGDPAKAAASGTAAVSDFTRAFALNPSFEARYQAELADARRRAAAH
ncbi:MAG TPA: protein kinase [Planctomycetota bacterium]